MTDEDRKIIKAELAFTDELVEFVKKYSNQNLAEDVRQTLCHFWDSRFPKKETIPSLLYVQWNGSDVEGLARTLFDMNGKFNALVNVVEELRAKGTT